MRESELEKAIKIIKKGGVIACGTDTVYGLIADAANKKAVEKIFKIKKRPRSKPLAVFVSSIKQAKKLAQIDKWQEKVLRKHWPGPYTFILKSKIAHSQKKSDRTFFENGEKSKKQIKNQKFSKLIIGKGNTIGIRIPNHKFLLSLLKKIGRPLAQTSLNISGQAELVKIDEIKKRFASAIVPSCRAIDLIIDQGDLPKRKPSVIINLTENKIKILRK